MKKFLNDKIEIIHFQVTLNFKIMKIFKMRHKKNKNLIILQNI